MRKLFLVALVLICIGVEAHGETVKSLRLILPPQPGAAIESIQNIFTRQVQSRCDAKVVTQGEAPLTVELAIEPGIGIDGYKIADGAKGTVRIIGNDDCGLLYGVGKFLHTSRYDQGGFTAGTWRGTSVPTSPLRGIYFATHFRNFYEVAPAEEVQQYCEDLALWGFNAVAVCYPVNQFQGIDDPAGRKTLEQLRGILKAAKKAGLKVCVGAAFNIGWASVPKELLAEGFPKNFNVCPSKPAGSKYLLDLAGQIFDEFSDIGIDYVWQCPYDEGGCLCKQCAPWGAHGYVDFTKALVPIVRARFPDCKIILSTWQFDSFFPGEWEGLSKALAQDKTWVDYILASSGGAFPRYPLDKGVPGGLPLLDFPEISMWGQYPWGAYGANPLPNRIQEIWDETKGKLGGGFPYSEGIYEDLNKVICAQHYWDSDRPAMDIVKEYIAFEFSPEVVDDVAAAIQSMEKNHFREGIDKIAIATYQLMERADAKLSPQVRSSWRWQILYLRALIDQEMYKNEIGKANEEVFQQASDELMKIYLADKVYSLLRPDPVGILDTEGPALGTGYAKTVAESKPVAWWRMRNFRDHDVEDSAGNKNMAISNGVGLGPSVKRSKKVGKQPATEPDWRLIGPLNESSPKADDNLDIRAAQFRPTGLSRFRPESLKGTIKKLSDSYSVELWFYNTKPYTAREVTGYVVSLSRDNGGPGGTLGDSLGIGGTIAGIAPGHLFFANGIGTNQIVGKTELTPETWYHVVMVRDGKRIAVYLNGNAEPEISGQMEKGYPNGETQVLVGGRSDSFSNLYAPNFEGKIAEVSVYNRALASEEAASHYKAAKLPE